MDDQLEQLKIAARGQQELGGRVDLTVLVLVSLSIPACDALNAMAGEAATQQVPQAAGLCANRPAMKAATATLSARRSASDLYCVDLFPTAAGGKATGVVELGRVPTPFGAAVRPDGRHVYELYASIEGLPEPEKVGPYTTFVAWATTPYLEPVVKLGAVQNGRNQLGRVEFNKFLILITAESSADVPERQGRLVLRGRSPSSLMEGHDLLAQAPSAVQRGGGDAGYGTETRGAWQIPPTYPDIPMLPGMMSVVPTVRPFLPVADSIEAIPEARARQLIVLGDGGTLDLEAKLVRRKIKDQTLLMLGFNGQHPGPMIRVPEKSTIFVNFANNTPYATSVHWHGVRVDNRFDGVPGVTQDPVMPGGTFRYQIHFRDAGIYWYHPHHREDIQQELGLYGNILVDSPRADYLNPVNREEILMLDDLLLGSDGIVPFGEESANYMLMGRFGNVFLVNGEPAYDLRVKRGEVVRFFFTNASNTRTFNVSFAPRGQPTPNARLPIKVVGSDIGKFEREEMAESVVLAPAERYIVEVQFDQPGEFDLVNHVQAINHRTGTFFSEMSIMGTVRVAAAFAEHDHTEAFATLRENADVVADIDRYREAMDRPVDYKLVLSLEVKNLPLPLEQSMLYDWIYFNGIEWAGTMPMMNWVSTGNEVRWILRDAVTGKENMEIDWRFRVGDVVKIRLHNDRDAFHAMQHPVHIHGQRFLVLGQNGVPNDNLVWKDTVLLPTGSTTDILLELSNPGRWMVHCHIAEHLESGMKFVMEVEEGGRD